MTHYKIVCKIIASRYKIIASEMTSQSGQRAEGGFIHMAKTISLHGHNYRLISPKTQFASRIKRLFNYSSDVTLDDCYGRYSHAKANAYEYCRAREREFDSYDGVITGHNSMTFSYAFTGWCDGKLYLIYITHCHDYALEIEAR